MVGRTNATDPRKTRTRMAEGGTTMSEPTPLPVEELHNLLVRNLDQAYLFAHRLLGDWHLAQDAVQEACVQCIRHPPERRDAPAMERYLLKRISWVASDMRRSNTARRAREERLERRAPETHGRSDDQAVTNESSRAARKELAALPSEIRAAVCLCCEEGYTLQEAANILRVPLRTVHGRVKRGLEQLRARMAATGFAALTTVALGEMLRTAGVPSAPAQLASALEPLVSQAARAAGAHSPVAIAKGSLAVKSIAGILAAGAVAGVVAVSTGAFSERSDSPFRAPEIGSNPVTGQVAREEVFEFAEKPQVEKVSDEYVITFAAKGKCDATVVIVGPDGRVVRHLASGVLGDNAPWPYKQGALAQSIEWDDKDDAGRPAPRPCKVRVSLGLKATWDKSLGFDGLASVLPQLRGLGCGPDGTLYVLACAKCEHRVSAFSRDGGYLRAIYPPPENLSSERLKGFKFHTREDGVRFPVVRQRRGVYMDEGALMARAQAMAVSPDGKIGYVGGGGKGPKKGGKYVRYQHLVVLGTDGSTPSGDLCGPLMDTPPMFMTHARGRTDLAAYLVVSPDGKTVYASARGKLLRTGWTGSAEAKSFGPGAIKDARGVAVDPKGNLYVADAAAGQVVVLEPDGTKLRAIPVPGCDGALAVHPKTGNLYVLSFKAKKLAKLSPEGRELASLALPGAYTSGRVHSGENSTFFILDASAEPPVLWVANANDPKKRKKGAHPLADRLWRVTDKGASFEVEDMAERASFPGAGNPPRYLAVDPVRDEVYVRWGKELVRFDGKSGVATGMEMDRPWEEGFDWIHQVEFGPDERIYITTGYIPQRIFRIDRAGVLVSFPAAGKTLVVPGSFHREPEGNPGFDVAPNGGIYVAHHSWPRGDPKEDEHPDEDLYILVDVFSPDGRLREREIVKELPPGAGGVRVDRAGNIYVGLNARPPGSDAREHFAIGPGYAADRGMVLKFPPSGGRINYGRRGAPTTPEEDANLRSVHRSGNLLPLEAKDLLWGWFGLSPQPPTHNVTGWSNYVGQTARFDVDAHGRVFAPDAYTNAVQVLDTQGNAVLRIGSYGNPDSAGPKSGIPTPEIPFAFPYCVAATDEALYVSDYVNMRVVRIRLGYEVEESVPVP